MSSIARYCRWQRQIITEDIVILGIVIAMFYCTAPRFYTPMQFIPQKTSLEWMIGLVTRSEVLGSRGQVDTTWPFKIPPFDRGLGICASRPSVSAV
jgi:hypothetical protein